MKNILCSERRNEKVPCFCVDTLAHFSWFHGDSISWPLAPLADEYAHKTTAPHCPLLVYVCFSDVRYLDAACVKEIERMNEKVSREKEIDWEKMFFEIQCICQAFMLSDYYQNPRIVCLLASWFFASKYKVEWRETHRWIANGQMIWNKNNTPASKVSREVTSFIMEKHTVYVFPCMSTPICYVRYLSLCLSVCLSLSLSV